MLVTIQGIVSEEFANYIMSGLGDAFFEEFIDKSDSWSKTIKRWKKNKWMLCLFPDDAGDKELAEF